MTPQKVRSCDSSSVQILFDVPHTAFGERTLPFAYFGLCRYSWENFFRVRIFCVIHSTRIYGAHTSMIWWWSEEDKKPFFILYKILLSLAAHNYVVQVQRSFSMFSLFFSFLSSVVWLCSLTSVCVRAFF